MKIRGFKIVDDDYIYYKSIPDLPIRGTNCSAGYDFYSPRSFHLYPGDSVKIYTNIKAYMQENEYLELVVRNSTGNAGLQLVNTLGIIDSDYYNNKKTGGNIIANIKNTSKHRYTIQKGERFIQGIFKKYLTADDDAFLSHERIGGNGSTGKQ